MISWLFSVKLQTKTLSWLAWMLLNQALIQPATNLVQVKIFSLVAMKIGLRHWTDVKQGARALERALSQPIYFLRLLSK